MNHPGPPPAVSPTLEPGDAWHDDSPPPVPEPLDESAPLARELAGVTCRGCGDYHGFWPYMRLMGMGKTLSGQSLLYRRALREEAWRHPRNGQQPVVSVLVSGCADYSALAHVVAAFQGAPAVADITVLDRCDTPLLLSRWYATREKVDIRTLNLDILDHTESGAYDLILTSSFFGYFDERSRPLLFARYRDLLRPGGRLIFANRLRDGHPGQAWGFTAEQIDAFAALARHRAASLPPSAALDPDEAAAMARRYAHDFRSYPLPSIEALLQLAEGAGFRPVRLLEVRAESNAAGLSGPTLADGSRYVFAVLER